MPFASLAAPLLGPLLGLFGGGGGQQSSTTTTTTSLTYSAPANDLKPFDWQASAGAWEAIGVTLLALLLLGSFSPTRPLAIGIAFLLGAVLILGKVNA